MRWMIACGLILGVGGGGTVGEAHIGDAEAALVARYGEVRSRHAEHTLVGDQPVVIGERLVFRNADWQVRAVMLDGACVKITYLRRGAWTETHYLGLLGANADRGSWHEIGGDAPKWQRTWRRSDGLVAKWMYAGGFIIESHAYVEERARLRASRSPAADRSPAG